MLESSPLLVWLLFPLFLKSLAGKPQSCIQAGPTSLPPPPLSSSPGVASNWKVCCPPPTPPPPPPPHKGMIIWMARTLKKLPFLSCLQGCLKVRVDMLSVEPSVSVSAEGKRVLDPDTLLSSICWWSWHAIWLKAPEQLPKSPSSETVLLTAHSCVLSLTSRSDLILPCSRHIEDAFEIQSLRPHSEVVWATFFQKCECKWTSLKDQRLTWRPLKQQGEATTSMYLTLWLTIMQILCLGSLTCSGKQQYVLF